VIRRGVCVIRRGVCVIRRGVCVIRRGGESKNKQEYETVTERRYPFTDSLSLFHPFPIPSLLTQ